MRAPWARAAAALAAYAVVVVILTWPLGEHLATHLPDTSPACRCDTPYMAWALARESQWIVSRAGAFSDAGIFHPAQQTLFYGDTGFGVLPLFLPTFLISGNPTLAVNLLVLGGVTLTALALHFVTVRWTGSHLAGAVGGSSFLAARWVLWGFIPCAPSYAMLAYLPVIVYLAAVPARRWRDVARLLPFVVMQSLGDVVYLTVTTLGPLGLLAVARSASRSTRRAGLLLAAVVALGALAVAPVLAAHFAVKVREGVLQSLWHNPSATVLPWGPFAYQPEDPLNVPIAVWVVIGLGLIARLATPTEARDKGTRRAWTQAALWAVAGLLFSLRPYLFWPPSTIIALPYLAPARLLGLYTVLRTPSRLGLAALVGVALLAGLGAGECARRAPERGDSRAGTAVVLVALAALWSGYLYERPTPIGAYPLAAAVGGDTALARALAEGEGPVLELPVSIIGGVPDVVATYHVRAMYRAIFHRRPVLNGYSSYWPAGFDERMRLAMRLPSPAAVDALSGVTGLRAVVVRLADMPARARGRWLALSRAGGNVRLRFVLRDDDNLLFTVR
jgi:hypothetical protein